MGIETSFDLSFDLLDTDMQRQWCMLTVFRQNFDREAARTVWNLDADLTQDILSKLVNYSLLGWIPSKDLYRWHDLFYLFADAHLSETDRRLSQRRYATYYKQIS